MEPKTLRFTGEGGTVLVSDAYGEASDPPVLLLHGGGQSRSAWRRAARALGGKGFYAHTIDLRGHGDSQWSADGDYHFTRYVGDLRAIIDTLAQPAILVGASLGGHIATIAASRLPGLIRALALADVTPWLDEHKADDMRNSMRRSADGFETLADAAAMVATLRRAKGRGASAGLAAHMRQGEDGRFYWRWDARFLDDSFVRHGGEGGMFAKAAAELKVPVLLMHAEHSTVVDEAQVQRFRQVVPWLRYEKIAGIGHMVSGDANDAYLPALLRFFETEKLSPPRSAAAAEAPVDHHFASGNVRSGA